MVYKDMMVALLLCLAVSFSLAQDLIALHDIAMVRPGEEVVLRLVYHDASSKAYEERSTRSLSVMNHESDGQLFQLSHSYSNYGYEPKAGSEIANEATITGSNQRLVYRRPTPDSSKLEPWGTFKFTVTSEGRTSRPGTVTLVNPDGCIVGSDFLLGPEGWAITGNKGSLPASYHDLSRGELLNRYITGSDREINVASAGSLDQTLWMFHAPTAFTGNLGISYGGALEFTLAGLSGDFTQASLSPMAPVVRLRCDDCPGPVTTGITLIYPAKALASVFDGASRRFSLRLLEGDGWLKDPQNTLADWIVPSKCDLISVLSRLSSVEILGDWTAWHEVIALDDVILKNLPPSQLPVCAQMRPDASVCNC